jgi:hypothetical protein
MIKSPGVLLFLSGEALNRDADDFPSRRVDGLDVLDRKGRSAKQQKEPRDPE